MLTSTYTTAPTETIVSNQSYMMGHNHPSLVVVLVMIVIIFLLVIVMVQYTCITDFALVVLLDHILIRLVVGCVWKVLWVVLFVLTLLIVWVVQEGTI